MWTADLHGALSHQQARIAPRQPEFGQALQRNKGKNGNGEDIRCGQSVLQGGDHGVQHVMGS
jgi:hypothetical protein